MYVLITYLTICITQHDTEISDYHDVLYSFPWWIYIPGNILLFLLLFFRSYQVGWHPVPIPQMRKATSTLMQTPTSVRMMKREGTLIGKSPWRDGSTGDHLLWVMGQIKILVAEITC